MWCYRIVSNKRPTRALNSNFMFQGAFNRGGAIIRGEALINNITKTQSLFLYDVAFTSSSSSPSPSLSITFTPSLAFSWSDKVIAWKGSSSSSLFIKLWARKNYITHKILHVTPYKIFPKTFQKFIVPIRKTTGVFLGIVK